MANVPPPKVNKSIATEVGDSAGVALNGIIVNGDYNTLLTGTRGVKIYNEMRLGDATVKSSMLAVKQPILSARWYIREASNSRYDEKVADFVKDAFFHEPTRTWQEMLQEILLYLDYGRMPFEIVWEFRRDGMIGLRKLAPRYPDTVYGWKLKDGAAGIIQQTVNGKYEIPMEKMVIFVNQKEGDNWEGISLLRSAYKHWYIKDKLYLIDAISAERQGLGVPYAKKPAGATPQEEAKVDELLQNIRANDKGYMSFPSTWEVGFMDMKSGTTKPLLPVIQHHDRAISLNVLAQFLQLGSTGVGSFALSADQSKLFLLCLEAIASHVRDALQSYVIKKLVDMNFVVDAYPTLEFEKIGSVDHNLLTTSLQRAMQIGMFQPQDEDESYLRDIMDMPEKNDKQAIDITMFDDILADLNTNMNGLNMANGEGIAPVDGLPTDEVAPLLDENGDPIEPEQTASWNDEQWYKAAEHFNIITGGATGVPLSEETKRKISEALSKGKGKKGGKGKGAGKKKTNPEIAKKQEEIKKMQVKVAEFNNEAKGKLLELKAKGEKLSPEDTAKMQLELFHKKNDLTKNIAKLKSDISDLKSADKEPATPTKASEIGATLDRLNGIIDSYEK